MTREELLAQVPDNVQESDGFIKLLGAADCDENKSPGFHDYYQKVMWVIDRAIHYADKTGLTVTQLINAWEIQRTYWYMNFYQDSNQPELTGDRIRVFDTLKEAVGSFGTKGFRCPACDGVSSDAYACDSGLPLEMNDGNPCNWKVYGLFGDLGKGITIFVNEHVRGDNIFMPIAYEEQANPEDDDVS